jgi:hypothetical protein
MSYKIMDSIITCDDGSKHAISRIMDQYAPVDLVLCVDGEIRKVAGIEDGVRKDEPWAQMVMSDNQYEALKRHFK